MYKIKNVQKGGFPLFEVILGISDENGVQSWPPMESKPAEKTVHRSSEVI